MAGIGIVFAERRHSNRLIEQFGGNTAGGARDEWISRVAPIEIAGPGDLAPLFSRRYLNGARQSGALILTTPELGALLPAGRVWIHGHPVYVFARILMEIEAERAASEGEPVWLSGAERAHIDARARIHPTVKIGPGAVVYAGVEIGEYSRIEAQSVLYGGTVLGARVVIGAGSVIGRPGFGYTKSPEGQPVRIPQLGGVVIEDDAGIGALCTVDAGTLEPTRIGRGTQLDAHVHVGHNGRIGDFVFVAAQAGFAGSVEIGRGVSVGGQAGVADHVRVGEGAMLAAKAGVIGDVPEGAVFAGYPAVERGVWLRGYARLYRQERRRKSRDK